MTVATQHTCMALHDLFKVLSLVTNAQLYVCRIPVSVVNVQQFFQFLNMYLWCSAQVIFVCSFIK